MAAFVVIGLGISHKEDGNVEGKNGEDIKIVLSIRALVRVIFSNVEASRQTD